ncbi:uncharacterized protein [Ptychodera flava]|uniref:uncharacterized protein n=1 Tax=Ptychodera flava TaxID=63121 RepID=UPI003969DFA7
MASPVSDDQGHQASQTGYNEQSQNTPVCGPENEPDNESSSLLFLFETWNTKGDESAPCHKDIVEHFCNKQLNSNEKLQLYSTVLDVNVSEDQRKDAVAVGVILIPPKRKKNTNPERDPPTLHWLFYHEIYYPQLRNVLKNVKYVVGYKSITERAAEEIQEGLFPNARLELIDLNALPPPPGALFVFTTWDKSHLGLSQYHRTLVQDFCARKATVGEVLKVYSTLLSIDVSKSQKEDAEDCSVTLIKAQRKKRATPEEDPVQHNWLLNHEIHYPDLKKLRNIHYVVGYAPNTGKAAADIKEHIFPEAKLYLINHKHSEDDSLPLTSNPSQSNFDDNMLEMAQKADAVFSMGPSMYNYFDNKYRAITSADKLKTIPHVQLLPKPRPCFFNETVQLQNEVRNHVIISYGKVDLKKLDNYETLASAVDKAGRSRYENHAGIPTWEVCSVHTIDAEKVSEIIQKLKGSHCKLQVKEVSTAEQLVKDLKQSHLCLAKRDEDYGFHGLEAMAIGLPILADDDSQLAQFIKDYFPDCMDYCILRRDEKRSEKIMNMISHTNTAFQQARKLKMTYMMSEAVAKSYATFAAMFLPQIQIRTVSLIAIKHDACIFQIFLRIGIAVLV